MRLSVRGREYMVQFHHIDVAHDAEAQLWDAKTTAVIQDLGGLRSWSGTAYKSKKETWETKRGEKIAFERAVNLAFRGYADKQEVWGQFVAQGGI